MTLKARPILFQPEMARALWEGRKTQTRRIVKLPGVMPGTRFLITSPKEGLIELRENELRDEGTINYLSTGPLSGPYTCPYGKPGDLLWVREKHWCVEILNGGVGVPFLVYDDEWKNGLPEPRTERPWLGPPYFDDDDQTIKWGARPSIHMPRWASRMTLELTEVRVERVLDITEAEAEAEGVAPAFETPSGAVQSYPRYMWGFWKLWISINGVGSWDANPWVWALVFTVHKRNVDALTPHSSTGG